MTKYPTYRIVALVYLAILAIEPITALFWNTHWGWLKANWISYPVMLISILVAMRSSRKEPRRFLLGVLVAAGYATYFVWHGGDWESIIRCMVALLPLLLYEPIRENLSPGVFEKFVRAYLLILLVPVFICVLQLMGLVIIYDPGMVYDLFPGRISGGYNKPNNLNALLFPAFLYGFYLFYNGKKRFGVILSGFVFLIVIVSGLRTSAIAYGVIFLAGLLPRLTNTIVLKCFRYFVFAMIGLGSFLLLSVARENVGLKEGLRLRLPMWMVQAEYFVHAKPIEIFLGKGEVHLPSEAAKLGIASLDEAHNNDFRIMITFGIVGYLLYSLLMRHIAIRIKKDSNSEQLKFLHNACLIHVLLYSVTNEPVFYPGILWPMTVWMFFTDDRQANSLHH